MIIKPDKNKKRCARHYRIRNKINGTENRPRLNVFRSLNHIYAQIIDDTKGVTLAAASSLDKEIKDAITGKPKKDTAKAVGELIARKAKSKGIEEVVFDRSGYIYTGRVAFLAQGAREAGLKF